MLNKKNNNNKFIRFYFKISLLFIILILIIINFFFILFLKDGFGKNYYKKFLNLKPTLPESDKDYIVKEYHKSSFNSTHIRYNFQDLFNKRKLFMINYSHYPYININKLLSYDENADLIYNFAGMLNITKLDYYYNNISIDVSNYNHIHLSMGFDKNYLYLSLISIASVLNTSSIDTYIHFHILCLNFKFKDMKKIIQLKRINKNVEFIFYNAKQAEYDFEERGKKEWRGVGDYTRILAPEIVNNTNKILIMDSGDVIAQKDISEVYFFDLEDNYFSWILEDIAGNPTIIYNKFFRNYFYPNSGICLVNVREFRKDNLYKKAFFMSKAYLELPCPYQDILFIISNYRFKYMPLKYNCKQFFDNDEQMKNKTHETILINKWISRQIYSPYKYSVEEILEAALDPVINHIYQSKISETNNCNSLTFQWIKYAKLTGFYEKIKKKYPNPFNFCEHNINSNNKNKN